MKRFAAVSGSQDLFYVVFGFRDGVEFICSLCRKPRFYKSVKSAEKAKRDWESVSI